MAKPSESERANATDPARNQHMQQERSQDRQQEIRMAEQAIEQGKRPWEERSGVMAVVEAVRSLEFPKTRDEIEREAGDRKIQAFKDKQMPLSEVLTKLKEEQFPSLQDFQSAVQRHWQGLQFEAMPEEQRPEHGGWVPGNEGP